MILWLLAILMGVLAGVTVPALWAALASIQEFFSTRAFLGPLAADPLGSAVLLSFGSGLAVAFIMVAFRGFRSADGFTYFISDLHFQEGRRKLRFSILHGMSVFFMLLGGGVVGIEGFGLEVFSALGSYFGLTGKLPPSYIRILAACGATATLAAVLGQPIAAFLFVGELLFGRGHRFFSFGPYAVSAFVASSVSQNLASPLGWFPSVLANDGGFFLAVRGETGDLSWYGGLLSALAVAAVASLVAWANIWLHRKTDAEFHSLFSTRRASDISPLAFLLRIVFWAAITTAVLVKIPHVAGTGVDLIQSLMSRDGVVLSILVIIGLRMFLSTVAYSVLGSMGLILPTLVLGALTGILVHSFVGAHLEVAPSATILLATGAVFSACFGTPVAATALLLGYSEGIVSDNAVFLFSAFLGNFLAHFLTGFVESDRLTTMGLYRHGIRFRNGMCFNTLSSVSVEDAMLSHVGAIPKASSLREAYKRLMDSRYLKLPVVDVDGKLSGVISLADFYGLEAWKKLGDESQVHDLVGVEELMRPPVARLSKEMTLESALTKMSDEDIAPVVDAEGKYSGILLRSDLENLYNKEVVKKAFRR